jgi:tRNA-specific 2-thiouridylase
MSRAVALFSGGLDSMLAARLVMEQGVEVTALQFITPFFGYRHKGREEEAAADFKRRYGIDCVIVDVSRDYVTMIRDPKYGYGKNFNPCIDCKIFMMRRAKEMMATLGADFVVTGEVLGQRPMSQRKDALRIVERDSGLDYYLLRPLSAKLLKPTYPEEHGLIDREKLLDISGRSRKRQMELAERFGISDYETPAGGCQLTDPILSKRVEWFLRTHDTFEVEDLRLLATGRHFGLPGCTLYVGRNKDENAKLTALARKGDYIIRVTERPGPVTLLRGEADPETISLAARITVRYSDARDLDVVAVGVSKDGGPEDTINVPQIAEPEVEALRAKY